VRQDEKAYFLIVAELLIAIPTRSQVYKTIRLSQTKHASRHFTKTRKSPIPSIMPWVSLICKKIPSPGWREDFEKKTLF